MGCGASVSAEEDALKVVVFGALGMVGGAVARAIVKSPKFKVIAVTRTPTNRRAHVLAEQGAVIGTADLNDIPSVERVMDGAYAVFLTTHYWEHMNTEKELIQGLNAIDAALKYNIRHFIMYGSSYEEADASKSGHFEAKAKIEEHLRTKDIPYTILRMPFFYENLLAVFKPHKLSHSKYAMTLPLENTAIDCMSVDDMGKCILQLLLKPTPNLGRIIHLSIDRLTSQSMADSLTKHLHHTTFVCPQIGIDDYASFKFNGAKELAAVFQYYRSLKTIGDPSVTRKLCNTASSFDKWVALNKDNISVALVEEETEL